MKEEKVNYPSLDKNVDLTRDPAPFDEPVTEVARRIGADPLDSFMAQFRQRMSSAWEHWSANIHRARDDVDFLYTQQWDSEDLAAREDQKIPALTLNVLNRHVNLVEGTARQSKLGIRVLQSAGFSGVMNVRQPGKAATPQPMSYNDVLEGAIRDIENRSRAGHEYASALKHAAEGGFGWLRVRLVRPHDNPFGLEPRIEHVKDRYSVYFDRYALKDDLSDARWFTISTCLPEKEFEARYPDAIKGGKDPWDGYGGEFTTWWDSEGKRVCDYFYKEPMDISYHLYVLPDGSRFVVDADKYTDVLDELTEDYGWALEDTKTISGHRVRIVRVSSNEVLEGPFEWPGMDIPIVPVFGRMTHMSGRRRTDSLHHYAKDAQRGVNYWYSAATQRVGLSPLAQWLVTEEMISGREDDWDNSHSGGTNVLVYNEVEDPETKAQLKPERQMPASMPSAEMQLLITAGQKIMEIIGLHEANLGEPSNEKSGKAIAQRQQSGDTGTFVFMDMLKLSVQHIGDILCDIVPWVYSNRMAQNIVMPDGTNRLVELNKMVTDTETGREYKLGNLWQGRYHASVDVGPAYSTQRQLLIEQLNNLMQTNPEIFGVLSKWYLMAMDMPNKKEAIEALEQAQQQITPEQQAKTQEATARQQTEQAKQQGAMAKAQADMQIAQLDLEEKRIQLQVAQTKLAEAQEKASEPDALASPAPAGDEGVDEKKIEAIARRVAADMMASRDQ